MFAMIAGVVCALFFSEVICRRSTDDTHVMGDMPRLAVLQSAICRFAGITMVCARLKASLSLTRRRGLRLAGAACSLELELEC